MRYFLLWCVLPFIVALSFYVIFREIEKKILNFLQVFRHYFIYIATVKVLQFLTFISDHSVFNKFYLNTFKSKRESYSFHGFFRKR